MENRLSLRLVTNAKLSIRKSFRLAPVVAVTMLCATSIVDATDYSIDPHLSLEMQENTNPRLTPVDPRETFGTFFDASAVLSRQTDTTTLTLTPRARLSRYFGDATLDSQNVFMNLSGEKRWERANLGLDFSYSRDTTLATESLTTGRVQINRPVDTVVVSPHLSYSLTATDSVDLNASHQDVSYENGLQANLFDYSYDFAGSTYYHAFSETTTGLVSIGASRFDVPDLVSTDDSVTALIGIVEQFSPTWRFKANGGLIYTDSRFQTFVPQFSTITIGPVVVATLTGFLPKMESADTIGQIYDVSLEKAFEKASLIAQISSTVIPSSGGNQIEHDVMRFGGRYAWSERMNFNTYYARYNNSVQQTSGTSLYDAGYLDADVSYQLTKWWTIEGHYTFIQSNGTKSAEGQAFTLSLRYSGDKISFQR